MNPSMVPYGFQDDLQLRLEKLSRAYDLATMKIFMAVESLGDDYVYSTYAPGLCSAPFGHNCIASYLFRRSCFVFLPSVDAAMSEPPINSRLVSVWHHDQLLQRRLDKLSDTYDLNTLKIYMTTVALGQDNISHVFDPALERRELWETFLSRKEACRLDLARHEKIREKYENFLVDVDREEQGKQFFHSIIALLKSKGAVDIFRRTSTKYFSDLESSFCGHLCKLFDKKIESWFDAFVAVNVKLTAHVKVSNLVRVLTGQVDLICRKAGILYAINVKVTGMPTPRPMDVCELCLVKAMVIQNGLADPDAMVCCLLICHLGEDRPVLRLWEYRPTTAVDKAIKEADVDGIIDAGKVSKLCELWPQNMCPPGVASLTARQAVANDPGPTKAIDTKTTNQNYIPIDKSTNHNYNVNEDNRKTPPVVHSMR
ncbi:hypothetical protein Btru_077168 [Bulinus truncatus]|nr:hypothetical protein Btru_077168 [Bulinus truncatus]